MQLSQTHLLPDKQAALERYLNDSAFDVLIEVLESGRFDIQVAAAQSRQEESDTVKAANAVALDEQARNIARAVAMLIHLKNQKEPFTTSTAEP